MTDSSHNPAKTPGKGGRRKTSWFNRMPFVDRSRPRTAAVPDSVQRIGGAFDTDGNYVTRPTPDSDSCRYD